MSHRLGKQRRRDDDARMGKLSAQIEGRRFMYFNLFLAEVEVFRPTYGGQSKKTPPPAFGRNAVK